MKNIAVYVLIPVVFVLVGWFANTAYHLPIGVNPIAEIRPRPLDKYSIPELKRAKVEPADVVIGKVLKDDPVFTSYEFTLSFDPTLTNGPKKTVSGVINIPKGTGPFPLIIMFRGYVDPKQYYIGEGTQPSAKVFAQNGFITLAPDFLGYGDSDKEAVNVFESRFQTFTTAAETIKSISTIKQFDQKNAFIWGHSNGGQISLTALEITEVSYPTVLWAPVSKPFPYSILYYTDDASDSGKFLRRELAGFENDYNADLYSLTNYLDLIKAPIQLNQGTADESVPIAWSDLLAKELKAASVSATYIKYPGANHNMQPSWNLTVQNNLSFFKESLAK